MRAEHIASARTDVFLPHRKDVFERYLLDEDLLLKADTAAIGGFLVH